MSRYDGNGIPVHHRNYPSGVSVRDIDAAAEGRRPRRIRFNLPDDLDLRVDRDAETARRVKLLADDPGQLADEDPERWDGQS